ncbi:HYR domain-containing protein, partial [Mariniflexile sp.]|uniref:HYR domain-containing protein n=1 Tax=Mariniflexile sp. TaxID=1979402 RepID=UPI003567D98D
TDNCPNATITNDAPASFPIGDTTVTWTVTDAAGNEATCIQTVTVTDNIKPVITECPATVSVSVDADACEVLASNVTLGTPTFTDNCPNTTITNDAPASFPIGDTTVTWTVTDAAGNEATCIQTVTVTDNIKPVITECPATVSVPVDADTCEVLASNVTLGTLTFTDNCPNATITNDAPASFPIGNTTVTWTVTDAAGNTATCTQTVTVIDLHSPKFVEALPVDGTFECDEIPEPAILSAIDNCGTVNVNFSEIRIDGDCTNSYIIQRTWTAKDDGGLTATHTQLITVQDTKAPELVSNLQTSLTANCESIPEVPQLEFSDNCSTDINVDFIETSTYSTSNSNYEIVRTWTVSDTCENEAIFKQTIAVTLNNLVSQVSDRVCIDDGVVNLDDYLPNNQLNGSWVVLEGSTQLNDNIFDTDNIALGNYKFSYTTSFNGCLHTIELSIDVHDECVVYPCGQEDVEISKVITPNGDSRNEFFEVTGIESCNFVIEIQIFNRWGAKIYENSNYKNDWNGFAHNSSVGKADKVPNGTYYYIINLKNSGLKPFAKAFYVGTK